MKNLLVDSISEVRVNGTNIVLNTSEYFIVYDSAGKILVLIFLDLKLLLILT
jgi:hypothetical protein